jgi:hypothetical protein
MPERVRDMVGFGIHQLNRKVVDRVIEAHVRSLSAKCRYQPMLCLLIGRFQIEN